MNRLAPLLLCVLIDAAAACPFCGPVAEPLATRRARSATVAVGETLGPAAAAADGRRRQQFQILSVFPATGSGLEPVAPDRLPVRATVTADFSGTALLFETIAESPIPGRPALLMNC